MLTLTTLNLHCRRALNPKGKAVAILAVPKPERHALNKHMLASPKPEGPNVAKAKCSLLHLPQDALRPRNCLGRRSQRRPELLGPQSYITTYSFNIFIYS